MLDWLCAGAVLHLVIDLVLIGGGFVIGRRSRRFNSPE